MCTVVTVSISVVVCVLFRLLQCGYAGAAAGDEKVLSDR